MKIFFLWRNVFSWSPSSLGWPTYLPTYLPKKNLTAGQPTKGANVLKLMRCHSEAVERLRRAVMCLLCADGELQAPAGVKRMALRKAVEGVARRALKCCWLAAKVAAGHCARQ